LLADHAFARRLQRVRLAWIASPEFEWTGEEPLRLVVFDHQCRFKQRALEELGRRGIPWTFAFKSPSLTGLWAATRANLGVTVRSSFWVPFGLKIVDHRALGLPDLGDTDVTIHYREDDLDDDVLGVVKFIERSILLRLGDPSAMGSEFRGKPRPKAGNIGKRGGRRRQRAGVRTG
jgi:DNA-binding transcriptional LysR family regulator